MTTKTSTYPLRLPQSLKAAVEKLSREDGTSVNQFVVMAVAEKVSAITTADYFARRRAKAEMATFDRILSRAGGEPPRPGDEVPDADQG
jgi:hypothetical protein